MSEAEPIQVVLIGHICIDHNTTEHATYTNWGSSVLYMAQYLKEKHALEPTVVTSYGPDMLTYLPNVKVLPKEPNQPETLVYENDTRTVPRIWKAHNIKHALPPTLTPEITQALQSADIIVVAPLLPNYPIDLLQEAMRQTKPTALKMLCPQGYFRAIGQDGLVSRRSFSEAPEILPLFDLVVYSEEDHPDAFKLAESWSLSANAKIILTQGSNGATIITKNEAKHIPTTPLSPDEIVDSVGCGDVFAATAAYHYRLSGNLEQAVKEAHKAAAQKLRSTPDTNKPQT